MLNRLLAFAVVALWSVAGHGQLGTFADVPVEIDAEQTRFVGGVAVAENNVVIRYAGTSIQCDYAEYNPDTRDALLRGNIRVYREGQVFTAERAFYNFETKLFRAADIKGEVYPFRFATDTLASMGANTYRALDGVFTTSDSSKPDYSIRARGLRIYPNKRVIFSRVTLVVGRTPIFWWPYLVQSLEDEAGFTLAPGYRSGWGAFLLTTYTFPISEDVSAKVRFDLRSERGVGAGLDLAVRGGKNNRNVGLLRGYYAYDSLPDENRSGGQREGVDSGRYRLSWQHRIYLKDDLYASIDINRLSDRDFLEDYFEDEFRLDPQPDNVVALTKWNEDYTLSLVTRFHMNDFQETTARLPELAFDHKRQPLFKTPLFYEGETSMGYYERNFDDRETLFSDYHTFRFDTFHQVTYPNTLFGWLSVVPRLGLRGTYYQDSVNLEYRNETVSFRDSSGQLQRREQSTVDMEGRGAAFRAAVNAGFEVSFKASKEWDGVRSRPWGLDGVMHVVQPYTNFSFVYPTIDPGELYQFDRYIPSTELPPLDFPQFSAIDSISQWAIWRWGVRNRWLTRRDNDTFAWLETDTFFDLNIDPPDYPWLNPEPEQGILSNLHNRLRWEPLPWVSLDLRTQIPLTSAGFVEFNSQVRFQVHRDVELTLGHRLIANNDYFRDSNQLNFGSYVRLGDNWGFSLREQYEFDNSTLQSQLYQIHRDLSSWVASLGLVVRENEGERGTEYGVLFSLTLKDFPKINLPVSLDSQGSDN